MLAVTTEITHMKMYIGNIFHNIKIYVYRMYKYNRGDIFGGYRGTRKVYAIS